MIKKILLIMVLLCTVNIGTPIFAVDSNKNQFVLTSLAFTANSTIPSRYTCDGYNVSPALAWQGVPATAKSLVLIMDDPDGIPKTWDHWLLYNLPATTSTLPEAAAAIDLPDGTQWGQNSWGKAEYGGPCPPQGNAHRYVFTLYALDTTLNLPDGANRKQIEQAMHGHIVQQTQIMAQYARRHLLLR